MLMGFTPEAVKEECWFGVESCSCRCLYHHKPGFAGVGGVEPPVHLHREGAVWGDLQAESHREEEVSRNKKWLVGVWCFGRGRRMGGGCLGGCHPPSNTLWCCF